MRSAVHIALVARSPAVGIDQPVLKVIMGLLDAGVLIALLAVGRLVPFMWLARHPRTARVDSVFLFGQRRDLICRGDGGLFWLMAASLSQIRASWISKHRACVKRTLMLLASKAVDPAGT